MLAATAPDLAAVRLHRHSGRRDSRDIHERYGYRYTQAGVAERAPKVRALARDAEQTHVLFNNYYRNYVPATPASSPPCSSRSRPSMATE